MSYSAAPVIVTIIAVSVLLAGLPVSVILGLRARDERRRRIAKWERMFGPRHSKWR